MRAIYYFKTLGYPIYHVKIWFLLIVKCHTTWNQEPKVGYIFQHTLGEKMVGMIIIYWNWKNTIALRRRYYTHAKQGMF
jgi:hypothetical protein